MVCRGMRLTQPCRCFRPDRRTGDSPAEAERGAGLDLAFRDRLDPGADNLGGIGCDVDDERDQGRRVRVEANPDRRQPEEDEEDLDQERGVADRLNIGRHRPPRRDRPGGPQPGQHDGNNEPDRHGRKRELQRHHETGDKQAPSARTPARS